MRSVALPGALLAAALVGACDPPADQDAPAPSAAVGLAEFDHGRTWAALWHLQRDAHEHPEDATSRRELALAYHRVGFLAEASVVLEELATLRALDRDETLVLGDCYLRTHRVVGADSLFGLVLDREGHVDARLLEARGVARLQLGRVDEGIRDLDDALNMDPSQPVLRLTLAETLFDRGDPEAAATILDGFSSPPADSARFHAIRGRTLSSLGDYEAAVRHLEAAARIDAFRTAAYHLLAQARRRAGDRDGARAAAARHAEIHAGTRPLATLRAGAAVVEVARALEAGDEEGALVILARGLEDDPDHSGLHALRGPLLRSRGDAEGARESFTALRQSAGGANPGLLYLDTGKELRRRGYLRTAARQFQIAANRLGGSDEATFLQALALLEAGDEAAAYEAARPLENPVNP